MARRGRDPRDMLARMSRILLLLREHPEGLSTTELIRRVGYGNPANPSAKRKFNRDLAALDAGGWRITTETIGNDPAIRRLRTVDSRFATAFNPNQRRELARAANCAGPAIVAALAEDLGRDPNPPVFRAAPTDGLGRLAEVQTAAADACLTAFRYKGRQRSVEPRVILLRPAGWYLQARDRTDGVVKHFRVDLIRGLHVGPPGSAGPVPADEKVEGIWDFMRRPVHDPVEVLVDTTADYVIDVVNALGVNGSRVVSGADRGRVVLAVTVVNRTALHHRLLELGERARLVGPDTERRMFLARLEAMAG